jgi:hypothetical protein
LCKADAVCQYYADQPGSYVRNSSTANKGVYKAWLSKGGGVIYSGPKDRFFNNDASPWMDDTYKLPDGTLVANNWTDLVTCDTDCLLNPIDMDPAGVDRSGLAVWTNTRTDGDWQSSSFCANWAGAGAEPTDVVRVGNSALVDIGWTGSSATNQSCSATAALYCFEQEPPCNGDQCVFLTEPGENGPDYNGVLVARANDTPINAGCTDALCAADAICQWHADGGSDGITRVRQGVEYKAWISTSTTDAKDRLSGGPWSSPNGLLSSIKVADDVADLIDGGLDAGINRTEEAYFEKNGNLVWTGTELNGTGSAANCANWTDASLTGGNGASGTNSGNWTKDASSPSACATTGQLYCFQQPPIITTAFNPGPSTTRAQVGRLTTRGAEQHGQTFIPTYSGPLTTINIQMRKVYSTTDTPEFVIVSLYDTSSGLPTGSPLASVSRPFADLGSSEALYSFDFSSASIDLVAGTQYAFLVGTDISGGETGFEPMAVMATADFYADGTGIHALGVEYFLQTADVIFSVNIFQP